MSSTSSKPSSAPRRQCCFSFSAYARALMEHLRRSGVRVQPGLTELELRGLESHLGFSFPPDLRALLQEGLPVTSPFPDWRSAPISALRARVQQPLMDLTSQVWNNKLWPVQWGARPSSPEQAARLAGEKLRSVPVLVPVYGNCFIPASESPGSPILLVQSGEVSVAGNDISDFFEKETFQSEEDGGETEEEDQSAQSSCLMGSSSKSSRSGEEKEKERSSSVWGRTLNPESLLLAFRRKKMFPRSIREIAGSRSAEVSPRPSVSSTHSGYIHQHSHIPDPPRRSLDVFPRKKNRNKAPALESLLGFTLLSPAWAAKRPRRIEFWSDLCSRVDQSVPSPSVAQPPPQPPVAPVAQVAQAPIQAAPAAPVPSASQPAPPPAPPPSREQSNRRATTVSATSATGLTSGVTDRSVSATSATGLTSGVTARNVRQTWLDGYLDDMAGRLRTGGWKEADISEMMVSTTDGTCSDEPSYSESSLRTAIVPMQTRAAVVQGLVFKVQELSDSLKRSGWSVQDVAEALNTSNLSLWASSHSFTSATPAGYITAR